MDPQGRGFKQKGTPDRDKFIEPPSNLLPPPIKAWQDGLMAVNRDSPVVSERGSLCAGYPCPDPGWLASCNDARRKTVLFSWLTVRKGWISKVHERLQSSVDPPDPPSTGQWNDFLFFREDIIFSQGKQAPSGNLSKSQRHIQNAKDIFLRMFGDHVSRTLVLKYAPSEAQWQEKRLVRGEAPSSDITKQVLWELSEQGFRFELVVLDRTILPALWNDPIQAMKRDGLLQAVFPGSGGYIVGAALSKNSGFAAVDWRERGKYYSALRALVQHWPNYPTEASTLQVTGDGSTERNERRLSELLANFYCQKFYDYFGRAAVVPRCLPLL